MRLELINNFCLFCLLSACTESVGWYMGKGRG